MIQESQYQISENAKVCSLGRGGSVILEWLTKRFRKKNLETGVASSKLSKLENSRSIHTINCHAISLGFYTSVLIYAMWHLSTYCLCLSLVYALYENRIQMHFILVPRTEMVKSFYFICQVWETCAESTVFREDYLNPLVILDMGSESETGGNLPCNFRLCIRHSFIHYSIDIYWAPTCAKYCARSSINVYWINVEGFKVCNCLWEER